MQLTVTINIDDELIKSAANATARALFRPAEYGNKGGTGYIAIAQQVEAAVKDLDFTTVARETAERFARGIIEDVTKEAIKKMAREAIKAEKEAGTLL